MAASETKEKPRGARHRARVMVALTPGVAEHLARQADEESRPMRWELHRIVIAALKKNGKIDAAEAERLWMELTRRDQEDE